jgi:hypothetical protein
MKINLLYPIWMDPIFYASSAAFALAMFLLVFSIRKYLEVKNKSAFEEPSAEPGELQEELPLPSRPAAGSGEDAPAPDPSETRPSPSRAEEFVKGLYQSMASLDGRMKNIEDSLSRTNVNKDFAATFLEDMISDFDSLDKEKIKARIEFLLADLKK